MKGNVLEKDTERPEAFVRKKGWETAPIVTDEKKGFRVCWEKDRYSKKGFFGRIIYKNGCCLVSPRSADIGKIKQVGQISLCELTQKPPSEENGTATYTVKVTMARVTTKRTKD